MTQDVAIGIDIGGSGIKSSIVSLKELKLLSDRYQTPTPKVSSPEAVKQAVMHHIDYHSSEIPVGIGFPGRINESGEVEFLGNLDQSWKGINIRSFFTALNQKISIINDADAAALTEISYDQNQGESNLKGLNLYLTFGTGLGAAFIYNGTLIPSLELCNLNFMNGESCEHYISRETRTRLQLSWKEWGIRVDEILNYLQRIFPVNNFILSGGALDNYEKWTPSVTATNILKARNDINAGIVGAALATKELNKTL